jgi:hypothetical protein
MLFLFFIFFGFSVNASQFPTDKESWGKKIYENNANIKSNNEKTQQYKKDIQKDGLIENQISESYDIGRYYDVFVNQYAGRRFYKIYKTGNNEDIMQTAQMNYDTISHSDSNYTRTRILVDTAFEE